MFKAALESILERTEGSLGALIMGTDGIAVEKVLTADGSALNLDIAAAELSTLLRGARRTSDSINLGELRELVISYGDVLIVLRSLSDEYYLALALDTEGNLGRGRYELRKSELDMAREFVL